MGSGLPTYCPLTKWYQASYSHRRPLADLQTSGILQHSSSIFWCFHFCWCQWFAKMAESVTCDRAKIGQWNRPTRLQRRWQVLVSRAKLHGFDTVERIFVRAKNRSNLKNRNHFTLTSLVGELMQIHLKVGKDYKRYTTMWTEKPKKVPKRSGGA